MRLVVFLVFLSLVTAEEFVEDQSEEDEREIQSSMMWGGFDEDQGLDVEENYDEGSGVEPTRPHYQCVKEFKDCVAGRGEAWVEKHTCRLLFCQCKERTCDQYFKKCQWNSWCLLKKVCAKSYKACRYNPRRESKCRRGLKRCLGNPGIDKKKTKKCLKTFYQCLSKKG